MNTVNEAQNLILKKLEEYGDTVVHGGAKKKRRNKVGTGQNSGVTCDSKQLAKLKPKTATTTLGTSHGNGNTVLSRRQKKRLKKKMKNMSNTEVNPVSAGEQDDEFEDEDFSSEEEFVDDKEPKKEQNKHLKLLSKELGLEEFKERLKLNNETNERNDKAKQPEVIVFKAHKRKIREDNKGKEGGPKSKFQKMPVPDNPEFNLEQARFEVRKLGIKGFHGNEKEEAMTALLVKLGAKPPKNKYVNYKEYQEQRKQAAIDQKQKEEIDKRSGLKTKKSGNRRNKKSRDKNDIGVLDGQVGRWKSGVQVIKRDDLKGLNKAKIKT